MMDEIERVKRALSPLVNEDMDAEMRDVWLTDLAREAILALREPTEAMIAAAAETPGMQAANSAMQLHQARGYGFAEGSFDGGSPLEQAWKAMIDVASNTIPIVDIADIDRAD
jgi:hypothetical protein